MTQSVVAQTDLTDSRAAGEQLATQISRALGGEPADAVVVFASPVYDYPTLLRAIEAGCRPGVLVGCSSAGEFVSARPREGSAVALALRSSDMEFAAGLGRGISVDRVGAAQQITASFRGATGHAHPHRYALVLTDALAGHADDLIEQLTRRTAGVYRFFGGGAGDDARFSRTHVFLGTEAVSDAAVGLEILSTKPIGIGVRHGWAPASPALRVTEAGGMTVASLNAVPAAEVFEEHAEATGQRFDRQDPMPFFLHNVIGVDTGSGYRLRVPLGVEADGSVAVAAEVPTGSTAHIMRATTASAAQAAADATRDAVEQLQGNPPRVALFFDCVATRLRLGDEFGAELASLSQALGPAEFVGCNTYGQIARAEGQFSGFHNCTAVVCVIPE